MKKHVLFLLSVFLMFSGLVTFIHAEEVETGPEESTEEPGGDLCFGFSDPSYAVIGENGAGTDAEKGIESDELTSFSADAASEADGILGFFRWLTKFTGVSEDVRKDANVAVMILTNDSNLTKDPVYIGAGARGIPQSISELMANDTDYNDLSYLTQSLEFIRECNELRRTDPNFKNTDGSDLLPLKVSSQLMAMSMLQLNWSSNVVKHASYFNVGENLAWGYSDPFRGWYDEEKELYESGEQAGTGHYRNICQRSYEATGFAIAKKNCMYDIAHGQVFTSFQLDGALSVDDYEKLVAAYLADISPDKPDPTPSPVPTATPTPEPTVPPTPIPESGKVQMFRMYNPNSGEHFYTGNVQERNSLISTRWKYEGVGFKAAEKSDTPMYRLYNENAGDHHYTSSKAERDHLKSIGWKDEGIGWYADDAKGVAMYRLYNPNCITAGSHHYTSNAQEKNNLTGIGWKDEGIGFYACK